MSLLKHTWRIMSTNWPVKTREMHNHHINSEIWNDVTFRDDDIIVSTWAKAGTTWVQQIVSQLLTHGKPGIPISETSPWVDMRVPPAEVKLPMVEALESPRVLKTHLPVDALRFSPDAKYIYVGRDGRDVVWSLHNHHMEAGDVWYDKLNNSPGLVGDPVSRPNPDVSAYFDEWLEKDGYPMWSFWENVRTWWEIRDLPNVEFVHFSDLKKDRPGEIRRLAEFLEITIDEDSWDDILLHTSFEHMKENAALAAPMGGKLWDRGAQVFINKGANGRWNDVLTSEQVSLYEETAVRELGEETAHWLANGSLD